MNAPGMHVRCCLTGMLVLLPLSSDQACHAADDSVPETTLEKLRGHPFSLFMLVTDPIQSELSLSPEQKKLIHDLAEGYVRDARAGFSAIRELRGPQAPSLPHAARERLEQIPQQLNRTSSEYERRSLEVLRPEQLTRLKQLRLRARGEYLFLSPEVARQLGLSTFQEERIRQEIEHCETFCNEVARRVKARELEPKMAIEQAGQFRREVQEKVAALLTPEQANRLAQLLGPKPPFETSELRFRLVVPQSNEPPKTQGAKNAE